MLSLIWLVGSTTLWLFPAQMRAGVEHPSAVAAFSWDQSDCCTGKAAQAVAESLR